MNPFVKALTSGSYQLAAVMQDYRYVIAKDKTYRQVRADYGIIGGMWTHLRWPFAQMRNEISFFAWILVFKICKSLSTLQSS